MKKISFLLIAISVSTMLLAQKPLTADQQNVQQTIIKMFEALSNRDSVSLKAYCTNDVSFYEYGERWNIDTMILKAITLNKAAEFKRVNSFDFINSTIDKRMALVNYRLQSIITRDGKQSTVQWLETIVLLKEKKQWKIKHLHSTLIKRS